MIIGGNKDSSRQSLIFPSVNSYILHSVNLYQDFVQFVAKRVFYLYANESLMQPVAVFFPSLFVTPPLHCEYPIRFPIKGATSFSCQGKSQVARECYTPVEVGQVSLFALALSTSIRLRILQSLRDHPFMNMRYFSDHQQMTVAMKRQFVSRFEIPMRLWMVRRISPKRC